MAISPYNLKAGNQIEYVVKWPRGEPASETRTGIVERRDGEYHAPVWDTGRSQSYFLNEKYLVLCTSCQHHRIDSVYPDQITKILQ